MNKNSSMLLLSLFNKTDNCIDYTLINNVLNTILGPVKSEKAHPLHSCIIVTMPARAVDDMGDLVEGEPFDVLNKGAGT